MSGWGSYPVAPSGREYRLNNPGSADSLVLGCRRGEGLGGGKFQGSVCGRCYPVTQVPYEPGHGGRAGDAPRGRGNATAVMRDDGRVYRSMTMAGEDNGTSAKGIRRAIDRGCRAGGHTWTVVGIGETLRGRRVRCVETGEEWPSISALSRDIGEYRSAIREACANCEPIDGRHYELETGEGDGDA